VIDTLVAVLFWVYAVVMIVWLLTSQFMDWSTPVKEPKMGLKPVYITCSSGSNAFTDCLVRRAGEYLELVGHSQMKFNKNEIKELIAQAQKVLEEIEK
jgi:hypothetical protein